MGAMRRLTASTSAVLVGAVVVAACGGGTASSSSLGDVVIITDPAIISTESPTTVEITTTTSTTTTSTTTTSTIAPTTTLNPATTLESAPPPSSTAIVGAESDGSTPDDGGSIEGDLVTIEPVFDVEPLQPFEVVAAVEPEVDDAGAVQPTGWSAFDTALDDALLRNNNTAASVAVSIGGEIVHAAAFGQRAPIFTDEAATPTDRFRIASISKPITAITLLQLVEDGVVGLDDPIGQLVADHLGVSPSAGARRLTIRRLLNHTSGFGKYDAQFFRNASTDCDDAARTGLSSGAGGGGYRYSNMNYCVAGVLVEALTGLSYEAAAYAQVLTPLGLSGLRLANTVDPGPGEIFHPYTPGRNYMETLGAAGSWIATPSDLVTIMNTLDPTTPGVKLLEPETLQVMKTPTGGQLGQRGYGLGLISYGPGRYGHTGTIENTHAMVQNRGDGVTWSITVSGPYPSSTPQLESIINRAFVAAGFIAG